MFSNNYGPRSHTNSNNDVGNLKFERKIIPYKKAWNPTVKLHSLYFHRFRQVNWHCTLYSVHQS